MKKLLLFLPLIFYGCGLMPSDDGEEVIVIDQPQPNFPEPQTCGTEPLGSTRSERCGPNEAGEILYVCKETGWQLAINTCRAIPDECESESSNKITWDRHIRPIMQAACLRCHSSPRPFDSYQVMADGNFRLAKESVRRINLDAANQQVMPPRPQNPLPDDQRRLFEQWERDGFLENNECEGEDPAGRTYIYQELDEINVAQFDDIKDIPTEDQPFTRYLLLSHKYNTRDSVADMQQYSAGIQKAVNSLSFSQEIIPAQTIDERRTQLRIDLRNYNLTPQDWQLICDVEPFDIIDDTTVGRVIQQLTRARQPFLHADNFIFTAFGTAKVYNALMRIPLDVNDLYRQLGVDYFGDIQNFDSTWLAFLGSSIADDNRALSRHESNVGPFNRGWMWQTYDTNDNFIPEKNFFQFPCPPGAGCEAEFVYDAGEILFTLPNGLMAAALYDGAGVRQELAPIDIVVDNRSPFDPEIENGLDCFRCHAGGLIPNLDQMRDSVLASANEFDSDDVDIIKELFPGDGGTQPAFVRDNNLYAAAIRAIGGNIFQDDPMNFFTDRHREDYNLEQVAAFVFLTPEDFRQELSESADARAQIPQLLSGGTITFDQLIEVFPIILDDFRIGQDPLSEQ